MAPHALEELMADRELLLSTGRRSGETFGSDRRQYPRRAVRGRVRLWLLEHLGFIEGALVDMSEHGLRIKLNGVVPTGCLLGAGAHRIDVYADHGDTFTVKTEVRHVTEDHVGLAAVDRVPIELFGPEHPASS